MRKYGWERCCADPLCDHTYAVVRVSKSKNEVAHVPDFNRSVLSLAKIDSYEWVEGLPEAVKTVVERPRKLSDVLADVKTLRASLNDVADVRTDNWKDQGQL